MQVRPGFIAYKLILSGAIPIAVYCGSLLPAQCDLTFTTRMSVSGNLPKSDSNAPSPTSAPPDAGPNPAAATESTIKTFYKGKMARYESANGTVMIYDGAKGRVYTLDTDRKTYQSVSMKDAQNAPNDNLSQVYAKMHYDVHYTLTKTDASKTEAGKDVRRYEVSGTAQANPEEDSSGSAPRQGGGRGGGRRRGGGGFPGGGFPGGSGNFPEAVQGGSPGGGQGRRRSSGPLPSMKIEGELWLSAGTLLPLGDKSPALALIQPAMPNSPFVKTSLDKLNRLKMIPLSSNITFKMSVSGRQLDPVTITTEVQSISDAPLEDSLFSVPADYHMTSE